MNPSHQLNAAFVFIVLCIGTAGFFTAAPTFAQDAATAISHTDKTWLTKKLKADEKHDGLRALEAAPLQSFEDLLVKTFQIAWSANNDQQSTISAADFKEIATQWAERHWELTGSPSERLFVLCESAGHRHGRGVYVFRTGAGSGVALQAPHRFNDLLTGSISIRLFAEQNVSAIALNTIHRKEIDLSHTKLHYINAFTAAVLKANDSVSILQVHGFAQQGKSGAAKASQLIISDTTKFPGRTARQTTVELKTTFGADHTRLFPIEVEELGGTTNRQSKVAQNLGSPNFLHLELSHSFRSELNSDASVREKFFASILRGVGR